MTWRSGKGQQLEQRPRIQMVLDGIGEALEGGSRSAR